MHDLAKNFPICWLMWLVADHDGGDQMWRKHALFKPPGCRGPFFLQTHTGRGLDKGRAKNVRLRCTTAWRIGQPRVWASQDTKLVAEGASKVRVIINADSTEYY